MMSSEVPGSGAVLGGRLALVVLALFGLAACSVVGDIPQPDLPEVRNDVEPRQAIQSSKQAVAQDNALAAAQGNAQDGVVGEAFDELKATIQRERPELFAGAIRGNPPTLYINGRADPFVHRVIGSAPFAVKVVEGMPWSWLELEERSILLADALNELGYRNHSVGFDVTSGQLEATVTRQPGLPSAVSELRMALPGGLAAGADITLTHLAAEDD